MNDIAIRIDKLSKQYRIGGKQEGYKTLRDTLSEAFTAPFRRLSSVMRGQSTVLSNETIWALKDISFEVKRGEVLGIIGRNGAGKSTLLKILSRITEPTDGYAEIRGRIGSLLEVGTGFHPELTGRENIYLNGAILGMNRTEINRKFDEIVAFAEIDKFIDTPVKYYSSGMYLRLAFSVAAHLEPDILLVDEVLAVGDISFQEKCIKKMSQFAKKGFTVLVVSHNMRIIETLTERCIYLQAGSLAMQGPVLEVIRRYQRESLNQSVEYSLPSEFDVDTPNPFVEIKNISLTDGKTFQETAVFEPGRSVCLRFNLVATENIPDATICIRFYRDRIAVHGNNSDHTLGKISLNKGQQRKLQIDFDALWLMPGNYSLVLFVKPSYLSRVSESISKFYSRHFVVEGSREHGEGYVYMEQKWSMN